LKDDSSQIQTSLKSGKLNLGWLMLDVADKSEFLLPSGKKSLAEEGLPEVILNKLILVPDRLLGQLINSNLEVRTSTAIDPKTGAAREGALFTYEAIPRSTVLWFGVVYKNPRNFKLEGEIIDHDIDWVEEKVTKGLGCMEELGVGGMVTRGMGRIRVLNL
jgi:CRISPR-associated protein Cmr4